MESRGVSGASLGALERLLARSWALLARSWALLGCSWALLGCSCGALGALLGALVALLGALGALLGRSWVALGRSWVLLGALRSILAGFWSSRGSILKLQRLDFKPLGVNFRPQPERANRVAGRQTDTRCEAKARRIDPSRSLPNRRMDRQTHVARQTDRHTLRSKRWTSRPGLELPNRQQRTGRD